MTSTLFQTPVRVYIEDTDAGGIVYYVNYLKFMERARTEFFRSLGYAKPAFISQGLLLVVASAEVEYKRPARLDDEIIATAEITLLAKSYVLFEQNTLKDDELLTTGSVKIACVNASTMRPTVLPKDIHETIQPWVRGN